MVDIPELLKVSIPAMVPKTDLKQYHSFAADYWLKEGDHRERLFHLVHSGRIKEAEMMVASKGQELLVRRDQDLYDLLAAITMPAEKYAARVLLGPGRGGPGLASSSTRRWLLRTS